MEFYKYHIIKYPTYSIADGFLLIYSVTDRSSFEYINELVNVIAQTRQDNRFPIVVNGNKCDLEASRQVSTEEGKELATRLGYVSFFETK